VNSTLKLFYDDEWIERKLGQGQTILKYKKIHGFSSFNENDLNLSYSGKFFSCRIKPIEFSSFSLHFEEYIDGVKVEDSKDYCNRFWEEWFSYHIGIDCREHCELITDSEDIKKFFEVPELLISEKCFDRWW
jgi:hypothetical protein